MRPILTIAVLLLGFEASAQQTFIEPKLNNFAKKAIFEGDFFEDYISAGIVVLESSTGKVIADYSIGYVDVDKSIPYENGSAMSMSGTGISRAVMYLAAMEYLRPSFVVDINGGVYIDSITGSTIKDHNHMFGGYRSLPLDICMDRSNVGMVKACEVAFSRNALLYERALKKTGITFENYPETDDEYYDEFDSSLVISPCEVIGYRSPYSLYQMTAWLNGTVNGGKIMLRVTENDSKEPICEINSVGISDLKSAMNKAVTEGLSKKMQSIYTSVGGISNVSPCDAQGGYLCLAIAYFPTSKPQYTVGCLIRKASSPAGRIIPTKVIGKIINYMAENHYLDDSFNQDLSLEYRYHRAEK